MQLELCLLQLLQGSGLLLRPIAADGRLLPAVLLHIHPEQQQTAAAPPAAGEQRTETLLLLPLLRRVPGVPLGAPDAEETIPGVSLRLSLPAAACGDTTAADLWGRAVAVLLQYLLQQQHLLQLHQRRVLELGCGLGIPSCLCCLVGAPRVCATDHDVGALCLASCNIRISSLLSPPVADAAPAAAAAAAETVAAAAARLLEDIRRQQQQQEKVLCIFKLLHALPGPPGVSVGPLAWDEDEAAVQQQLQQLASTPADTGPPQGGAGAPFDLLLAADVLFSDKGARALASTIKAIARAALGAPPPPGKGPPHGIPPFLCLISHQVRHAVYIHQKEAAKETADSALRSFISEFKSIGGPQGALVETYRRKPLRPGDNLPAAAAAAAVSPAAAADSSPELYVHLMPGAPGGPEGCDCLPEGSICLLAVAADRGILQMLPPPASSVAAVAGATR